MKHQIYKKKEQVKGGFVSASVSLSFVSSVWLCLQGWSKGVVFVNGKNLGRYWSVGPQQTLYVPGAWLNRWDNEVLHLTFNYLLLSKLFHLVLFLENGGPILHNLDYKHRAQQVIILGSLIVRTLVPFKWNLWINDPLQLWSQPPRLRTGTRPQRKKNN